MLSIFNDFNKSGKALKTSWNENIQCSFYYCIWGESVHWLGKWLKWDFNSYKNQNYFWLKEKRIWTDISLWVHVGPFPHPKQLSKTSGQLPLSTRAHPVKIWMTRPGAHSSCSGAVHWKTSEPIHANEVPSALQESLQHCCPPIFSAPPLSNFIESSWNFN